MTTIISDDVEELSLVKRALDLGILNLRETKYKDTKVDVSFKLSNGNTILADQYQTIVGEVLPNGEKKFIENLIKKEDSENEK